MKMLTVQEASDGLAEWLRRAVSGERIAINEGKCTVLLQPLQESQGISETTRLPVREALHRLQAVARLTAAEAGDYLKEVRAERLTDRRHSGQ